MPLLETHSYISQLFWLIVSFTLLYFLLSKICIPKITKILELRDSKINGAIEKAKILQEEAIKLREDYESKLAAATNAKNATIDKTLHEIIIDIENKNIKSEQKFEKMLADAEKKLEIFAHDSADTIQNIAEDAIHSIMKDFLKIKIDEQVVTKALKQAIDEGLKHDIS
jgi:F-type H+-transporting ATPase subunit b